MMTRKELAVLGDRVLHMRANPGLLAYSPSVDLLALGTADQHVHVYRLDGQPVHSVTPKEDSTHAERIVWKPDGQLLATAWDDCSVRLVGPESSKTVHHVQIAGREQGSVTCLAWSSNSLFNRASIGKTAKQGASWAELLEGLDDSPSLDLPRELALLDIESSLPKLSTIPFETTDELLNSRAALDALFRSFDPRDSDVVDILTVGTDDGCLHLSIYDSFVIGSFQVPPLPGHSGATSQVVLHAAHKAYSSHALLIQSGRKLCFAPLDLRFISASNGYLSLLASKSTALQNLLRYVNQVQTFMTSEWNSTQDLPSRFLANIDETLAENGQPNILQSMYHSVATGHTMPDVREWLVHTLRDRGHTRWEKAVKSGLESIRNLVHENMLPALERCNVILSRLSGIAKFQETDENLGYSSRQIASVCDIVACLNLVSANILNAVVDELDLFGSFSVWLRHEIDRLSSAGSSNADDFADKESGINHSKVLQYIQMCIDGSAMLPFLEPKSADEKDDWEAEQKGLSMFDFLSKQLQNYDARRPYAATICRLEVLCSLLDSRAKKVFQQIAEAEKRNVVFGHYIELQPRMQGSMNIMRICPKDVNHCNAFIVTAIVGDNILQIHNIGLMIINGISKEVATTIATCNLGDGAIRDMAFLNDEDLLILWQSRDISSILRISYKTDRELVYFPGKTSPHGKPPLLQRIDQVYILTEIENFEPDKLEVRGQTTAGKGDGHVRICVMNKLRTAYKIYMLTDSVTTGKEVV